MLPPDHFLKDLCLRHGLIIRKILEIAPFFSIGKERIGHDNLHLNRALICYRQCRVVSYPTLRSHISEWTLRLSKSLVCKNLGAEPPNPRGRKGRGLDFTREQLLVTHPVAVFGGEQLFAIGITRARCQQLAIDPLDRRVTCRNTWLIIFIRRGHVSGRQLLKNLKPQVGSLGLREIK